MDFDQKDKKYWKFGIFYINPEDKEDTIPKRTGIGFTWNFARLMPLFYIIIGLCLLAGFSLVALFVKLLLLVFN